MVTTDFRQEIEAEESVLLRRRFLLFSGLLAFFGLLFLLLMGVIQLADSGVQEAIHAQTPGTGATPNAPTGPDREFFITGSAAIIAALMYIICFLTAWRGKLEWDALRTLSYWLVFLDGLIHLIVKASGAGGLGLFGVMVTHIMACIFLPWRPMQALRPVIPLLVINALIIALFREGGPNFKIFSVVLSLFMPAPGVFITWLKTGRRLEQHKLKFLAQRYSEVRRELVDARRIHQALFPEPIREGPVRFNYRYEPMRQIGGDYLFVHQHDGVTSIVVMDVTGHGIPAALTVNRLHGELERLFAENPGILPPEVLRLLNRYVHLTLANHSVYVTAFCCRVDPRSDALEYASGGHPPAFMRAVDGRVEQLRDTAPQLGVFSTTEYQADPPRTIRFGPGDTLIAYTDGAMECADRQGRMMGIAGLERLIAVKTRAAGSVALQTDWTLEVMSAVEQFRHGPPDDDTLVIEISRPV